MAFDGGLPTAPDMGLTGRRARLFDRLIRFCELDPVSGCWIFTGGNSGNGRGGGYGRISVDGQMMAVHRVMFMIFEGPIHSNRQVDHDQSVCTSRACCCPDHLEAVTHKENQKRRDRYARSL